MFFTGQEGSHERGKTVSSNSLRDAVLATSTTVTSGEHTICRVCGQKAIAVYEGIILGLHRVGYFDCPACGYFQTESPYWLEQAYSSAVNELDTGILLRNLDSLRVVVMTLLATGRLHGRVLDHAGGYGVLVRLLRDAGVDAYWRDPYCQNLLARGFEGDQEPFDLITAFEVVEHLVDPVEDLARLLQQAPYVLLSTELVPSEGPPAPDWWYLGMEHGQHIGFLRARTLQYVAERLGCEVRSVGSSHHLLARPGVPGAWRGLVKLRRAWRLVARYGLTPKTMSDFELMTRRSSLRSTGDES